MIEVIFSFNMDLSGHLKKLVVAKRPVVNRFVFVQSQEPTAQRDYRSG